MREKGKLYRAGKRAPPLKLLCVPWENGSKLEPKNQKPYKNSLSQDDNLGSTNLEASSCSKRTKILHLSMC